MKSGTRLRTGASVLFAFLAIAAQPSASGQTYTTFDAPGAVSTFPVSINPAGEIAGNYFDPITNHGFLRATDGTITPLDAPGAIPGPAAPNGSSVNVITPQGLIVGTYIDANRTTRIFLRANDGTMSVFDPPQGFLGLSAAINPSATIAVSTYVFLCIPNQGGFPSPVSFLRTSSGTYSSISDPEEAQGTQATAINPSGVVTGQYLDANSNGHGFVVKP